MWYVFAFHLPVIFLLVFLQIYAAEKGDVDQVTIYTWMILLFTIPSSIFLVTLALVLKCKYSTALKKRTEKMEEVLNGLNYTIFNQYGFRMGAGSKCAWVEAQFLDSESFMVQNGGGYLLANNAPRGHGDAYLTPN